MAAGAVVKGEGKANDLLDRIAKDKLFECVWDKLDELVDPQLFTGRATQQVDEFMEEEVEPVLAKFKDEIKIENKDGVNV